MTSSKGMVYESGWKYIWLALFNSGKFQKPQTRYSYKVKSFEYLNVNWSKEIPVLL